LEPILEDAFRETKVFVVYYSHRFCGLCIPVTKALNTWFQTNRQHKEVSLIFATRLEENNEALTDYLKQSGIRFPALDTKHFRHYQESRANPEGAAHPFYSDFDDGVPRFRFFYPDGREIDPREHGEKNIYEIQPSELDSIIGSILRFEETKSNPPSAFTLSPDLESDRLEREKRVGGIEGSKGTP